MRNDKPGAADHGSYSNLESEMCFFFVENCLKIVQETVKKNQVIKNLYILSWGSFI